MSFDLFSFSDRYSVLEIAGTKAKILIPQYAVSTLVNKKQRHIEISFISRFPIQFYQGQFYFRMTAGS